MDDTIWRGFIPWTDLFAYRPTCLTPWTCHSTVHLPLVVHCRGVAPLAWTCAFWTWAFLPLDKAFLKGAPGHSHFYTLDSTQWTL